MTFLKNFKLFATGITLFCSMGMTGCFWNSDPSPSPRNGSSGGGGGAMYGGQESFIAVDWNNGKILAEQNSEKRRPVGGLASVTTALVALDWLRSKNGDRNALLIIPNTASQFGSANPLGLQGGDRMSVRDAIFAAMLADDPVAAEALGEYFGWQMTQQIGGGRAMDVFVEQMNALAKSVGAGKTRFQNAHGLALGGNPGESTAKDMARMAVYALKNPQFNFYVAQSTRSVTVYRAGQSSSYDIQNTNQLLGASGVDGVKYSATPTAGAALMVGARKKDRFVPIDADRSRRIPYRMVVVSLGSSDPFNQTAGIINHSWGVYEAWIQSGMRITDPGSEMLNPQVR